MTRTFFKFFTVGISLIVAAGIGLWLAGYRINLTPSFPIGVWRKVHNFDPNRDLGKLVLISPVESQAFDLAKDRQYLQFGFSETSLQPLLKQVLGLPEDSVTVSENGVWIEGDYVLNSVPLKQDSKGRELTWAASQIIKDGWVWVMSTYSPKSFDSRYFGPLPMANIQAVMEPVWLWRSF